VKLIKKIPRLEIIRDKKIILGTLLVIPLFLIPWFLSIPVGVLSTALGNSFNFPNFGRLLLRIFQIFAFYLSALVGLRMILGKESLGLNFNGGELKKFLFGAFTAIFSVSAIFIIFVCLGLINIEVFAWQKMTLANFLIALAIFIISNIAIGTMEESVFRGYLTQIFDSKYKKVLTIILSGLIFALFHLILADMNLNNRILWLVFELIPAGLLLGWVFVKTKSLMLVIGIHSAYNFAQQALDIYGKYGINHNWENIILLGNSVAGPPVLVGTSIGGAGLIHLTSLIIISFVMFFYFKRIYRKSHNSNNF